MPKPKILILTCVSTEVNEKGQERLNKIKSKPAYDEDNPPEGSAAWFANLGLRPPKDLEEEEDEIDSEGYIELKEDELEYIHNEVILERNDFSFAVDSEDGLTVVYTKHGAVLDVLEDTDNIYTQLHMIDQSVLEYWWEEVKYRAKKIFKKEKDLILNN